MIESALTKSAISTSIRTGGSMSLTASVSLAFNGTCQAAFQYYERLFGGEAEFVLTWGESPMAKDAPAEWAEKFLYARLTVGELSINGGDALPGTYVQPSGFHLMVNVDNQAEGERLFQTLAEHGEVQIPFQETFWAAGYGQVKDRFGIPWEINCERNQ
jgi:PhnB protein